MTHEPYANYWVYFTLTKQLPNNPDKIGTIFYYCQADSVYNAAAQVEAINKQDGHYAWWSPVALNGAVFS